MGAMCEHIEYIKIRHIKCGKLPKLCKNGLNFIHPVNLPITFKIQSLLKHICKDPTLGDADWDLCVIIFDVLTCIISTLHWIPLGPGNQPSL